jgi:hypothetical protein
MNRSARYVLCLLLGVLWAATLGQSGSRPSWALADGSGSVGATDPPDGLYPSGFSLHRLYDGAKHRVERASPGNRCAAVARPERV